MTSIRRLVLDVLIPLNMPIEDLALKLSKVRGVDGVDILIQEVERKVEASKMTIEGSDINFTAVKDILDKAGASLQSIDRVTCGERIVG
ncbi:DUF211 domain-containing protein [Candidatus Micrarchaeota archaeon]|nr:DUF211 domain-containing protein [Candidatus Micrarchaeota archaeon]MBU1166725.1 DUF211 domain-containing protein [Candidatus Micrarchaeota archaeon]MBU1886688.1 DUF211 domain-containing protein [Candidatus Micrarchaeota archaeon]